MITLCVYTKSIRNPYTDDRFTHCYQSIDVT